MTRREGGGGGEEIERRKNEPGSRSEVEDLEKVGSLGDGEGMIVELGGGLELGENGRASDGGIDQFQFSMVVLASDKVDVQRGVEAMQQEQESQLILCVVFQTFADGDEVLLGFRHFQSANMEMTSVEEIVHPLLVVEFGL